MFVVRCALQMFAYILREGRRSKLQFLEVTDGVYVSLDFCGELFALQKGSYDILQYISPNCVSAERFKGQSF